MEDELYYTTADVARENDVTPAAVRLWEMTGRIKAIRTKSGQRLFTRSESNRVLAERRARGIETRGRRR